MQYFDIGVKSVCVFGLLLSFVALQEIQTFIQTIRVLHKKKRILDSNTTAVNFCLNRTAFSLFKPDITIYIHTYIYSIYIYMYLHI